MREIYLDHAATTPVRPEVIAVMHDTMVSNYGNPSSLHAKGLGAEAAVRRAREHVAEALGTDREEIFFTSGGTESNNLAIKGTARLHKRHGGNLIGSATEHPSVLEALRDLRDEGMTVKTVPVTPTGEVDVDRLASLIDKDTRLVSIAYVNNEIGTVQPIGEITQCVKAINPSTIVHVDAVQALGKVRLAPMEWGVDAVSLSGHKICGPKGIGALYVRRGVRLQALFSGGQQENGLRSGTENVPGIVGMGEAVRLAAQELDEVQNRLTRLRQAMLEALTQRIPGVQLVGPSLEDGAPHILNVSIPGIKGEVMVRLLGDAGVYVSTGSACSTKRHAMSHVLKAIGLDADEIDTSLRISFGRDTDEADAIEAAQRIAQAQKELVGWQR